MFTKYLAHPKLILLFIFVICSIIFGTIAFRMIEGWSTLDSFFVTVSTVTTIGYGEVAPTQPLSKIIASILMLLIVPTLLIGFGVIAEIAHEKPRSPRKKK